MINIMHYICATYKHKFITNIMPSLLIKRAYNYSDGKFTKVVDDLLNSGRRDLAALAPFGISEAWLNALKADNEAFAQSTADYYLLGEQMKATTAKNQSRTAILQQMQFIIETALAYFSPYSTQAVLFKNNNISRQNDKDLLRSARSIAKAAERYQAELSGEGISIDRIADFSALLLLYNTQLADCQYYAKERMAAVHARISLGNELYKKLRKLSTKGKLCWINVNAAFYSHYVLYPGKRKELKKV